jgi:hypothetical protein
MNIKSSIILFRISDLGFGRSCTCKYVYGLAWSMPTIKLGCNAPQ